MPCKERRPDQSAERCRLGTAVPRNCLRPGSPMGWAHRQPQNLRDIRRVRAVHGTETVAARSSSTARNNPSRPTARPTTCRQPGIPTKAMPKKASRPSLCENQGGAGFHPHRRLERSGRSPAAARSQHLSGSRPWKILGGLPGTAAVGSLATTADCVNHCVRQSPTTARAGSKPRPVSAGPHC